SYRNRQRTTTTTPSPLAATAPSVPPPKSPHSDAFYVFLRYIIRRLFYVCNTDFYEGFVTITLEKYCEARPSPPSYIPLPGPPRTPAENLFIFMWELSLIAGMNRAVFVVPTERLVFSFFFSRFDFMGAVRGAGGIARFNGRRSRAFKLNDQFLWCASRRRDGVGRRITGEALMDDC
ncbi:hypothetical protein GWI33_000382, partial [Rhynchophorus ferrugineus]